MPRSARLLPCALLAITAGLIALQNGESAHASQQPIGLWLPWEAGTAWRVTFGPHGTSSDGSGSALDFQPPDAGGAACDSGFSSRYWVVAAAAGRVIDLPNALEVDHGGGFRTGYMHMQEKLVTSGEVVAGERLGKVSCCPDGPVGNCCAAAPDDRVGIVTYNSLVHGETHLRAVKSKDGMDADLLQRIDTVGADGLADQRVGVRAGCRELVRLGKAEAKAGVLISDGVQDFRRLGTPQACFKEHHLPVHTVAVGPGGEENLKQISRDTGGQFINLNE